MEVMSDVKSLPRTAESSCEGSQRDGITALCCWSFSSADLNKEDLNFSRTYFIRQMCRLSLNL